MPASDSRLVTSGAALGLTGLVHRVREPAGPGPHPAVVMLHGRSGDENAMWVFAPALPGDWLLVAPRGIQPDPAGGHAWRVRERDEWPRLESFDEAVAAVARLIRALPEVYDADPGRAYLMGFSQGAATAYALALRHRELAGGVAGLVGFVPEGCEEQASGGCDLSGLPVFMAAGRRDPYIPLERSRACANTSARTGASCVRRSRNGSPAANWARAIRRRWPSWQPCPTIWNCHRRRWFTAIMNRVCPCPSSGRMCWPAPWAARPISNVAIRARGMSCTTGNCR